MAFLAMAVPCRVFSSALNLSMAISGSPKIGIRQSQHTPEHLSLGRTHAMSKQSNHEREVIIQNGLPNTLDGLQDILEFHEADLLPEKDLQEMINEVKQMFRSMGDGGISMSAYDTAWVALVPDLKGDARPQFPSSLRWIIHNQLSDGSWGDDSLFSAPDRLLSTLACVIALQSWSIFSEGCERGLRFLRENMWRLAEEEEERMPIGFEVAFPSLMDIAKASGLELPFNDPTLQEIYAKRSCKLKRIPMELMHEVPTPLLFSLEGMAGLEWNRLLMLQDKDGSFLSSPSSTAYALMQTHDDKCLKYLQRAVNKSEGGVPNAYPVDLFERAYAVDRLERLGISHYFELEIKECLDYVHRYWKDNGISWSRNSCVPDADDTSMGFRLLRLHGYNVSSDVFKNFEKDGEFFCIMGQTSEAITGMYNLNKASQAMFPGEDILMRANKFANKYLRQKQAKNQLVDKWHIAKDMPGEVKYALDFPFYASLPRIETRLFLEQYGGGSDVWIGKTLYRMPLVNNDLYLELAKADFDRCQVVHQQEWLGLQSWHEEWSQEKHGVSRESALRSYFLASACIFEPERAAERLGWSRTAILAEAVTSYFRSKSCTEELRQDFIRDFCNSRIRSGWKKTRGLVWSILQLVDHIASFDGRLHRQLGHQQTHQQLKHAWEDWMLSWSSSEQRQSDEIGLLLVRSIELSRGQPDPSDNSDYGQIAQLVSSICYHLRGQHMQVSKDSTREEEDTSEKAIKSQMRELLQCVLQNSNGLDNQTKRTFLSVVKSYNYAAHCSPATISSHITKVLFEPSIAPHKLNFIL